MIVMSPRVDVFLTEGRCIPDIRACVCGGGNALRLMRREENVNLEDERWVPGYVKCKNQICLGFMI